MFAQPYYTIAKNSLNCSTQIAKGKYLCSFSFTICHKVRQISQAQFVSSLDQIA